MNLKKWVSTILILSLINMVMPLNLVFANDLQPAIFLNISTARKLSGDIKFYKENTEYLTKRINLTDKEVAVVDAQNKLLVDENKYLKEDKQIYKTVADDYKTALVKETEKRVKAETEKPSRLTWFGVGFVTAVVAIIAGSLAIKK